MVKVFVCQHHTNSITTPDYYTQSHRCESSVSLRDSLLAPPREANLWIEEGWCQSNCLLTARRAPRAYLSGAEEITSCRIATAKGQHISWLSVSGHQMRTPIEILPRGAELGHMASRTALVLNWHSRRATTEELIFVSFGPLWSSDQISCFYWNSHKKIHSYCV